MCTLCLDVPINQPTIPQAVADSELLREPPRESLLTCGLSTERTQTSSALCATSYSRAFPSKGLVNSSLRDSAPAGTSRRLGFEDFAVRKARPGSTAGDSGFKVRGLCFLKVCRLFSSSKQRKHGLEPQSPRSPSFPSPHFSKAQHVP